MRAFLADIRDSYLITLFMVAIYIILVVFWASQKLMETIFTVSILKWLLQFFYLRSSYMQWLFSFRVCKADLDMSEMEALVFDHGQMSGLTVEEFSIYTKDGYCLTLHHLLDKGSSRSGQPRVRKATPVLIMHGLMQSSESFLCSERSHNLASRLCAEGYDVWLGNNRGSHYSQTHRTLSANSSEFWDFSIDDLALGDVPALVQYVLQTTGSEKLSIMGFSQGSAQIFLALSLIPELNSKVALFIALSPPVKLREYDLSESKFASMSKIDPKWINWLFGTRSMLPLVKIWKNVLNDNLYCRMNSYSMLQLFGWRCHNICMARRVRMFQSVYAESSVKCVQHWFQAVLVGKLTRYRPRGPHSPRGNSGSGTDSDSHMPSQQTCTSTQAAGEVGKRRKKRLSDDYIDKKSSSYKLFLVAFAPLYLTLCATYVTLSGSLRVAGSRLASGLRWLLSLPQKMTTAIMRKLGALGACIMGILKVRNRPGAPTSFGSASAKQGLEATSVDSSCPPNADSGPRASVVEIAGGGVGYESVQPMHGCSGSDEVDNVKDEYACDFSAISCPVAAIAGTADGLIDPYGVSTLVPACCYSQIVEGYEHFDPIWADDAPTVVFPNIVSLLDKYESKYRMATKSTSTSTN